MADKANTNETTHSSPTQPHDSTSDECELDQEASNVRANQPMPIGPEDRCQCGSAQCRELSLSSALDQILFIPHRPSHQNRVFLSSSHMDRLWSLMTKNQMDRSGYLALLNEYYPQRHCGVVWPPGSIAYRCRTCSTTPTMSLCADCFRCGNHEGHNYIMIKSVSGGTCDCGTDIISDFGHCKNHGPNAIAKRANEQVPEELVCVSRRSMPRLIHMLLISMRRSLSSVADSGSVVDGLTQLAGDNAIFRNFMVDALLSESDYTSQIQYMSNNPDESVARLVNEGLEELERIRKRFLPILLPANWNPPQIDAFSCGIKINCFLQELILWTICLDFPQRLVSFLLGFHVHDRYKEEFARALVNHYPQMMIILAGGFDDGSRRYMRDFKQSSRRIQQMSSQIYGHANLVDSLCSKEYTLHILIYCIRIALEGSQSHNLPGVLKDNPACLHNSLDNCPKIISHNSAIIKEGRLVPLTQDLNYILDFEQEAKRLISCKDLSNTWLEMLCYLQTMNPYKHRGDRDQSPSDGHGIQHPLFTLENEFCLSPLWSILNHFNDNSPSSLSYTDNLLQAIHANLINWFQKMGLCPSSLLDPYRMSFYIPIHRIFAATLRHLMFVQSRCDLEICDILTSNQAFILNKFGHRSGHSSKTTESHLTLDDFCKMLLLHPLQIVAICNEARCNMGMRMLGRDQAVVTYAYMNCCYSTIDLDMFLLKFCASKLDADYFLQAVLSKFHTWDWLSFMKIEQSMADMRKTFQDFRIVPEHIIQMVDNSLLVIIQLLTLSIYCNISEREQMRQEIIALISARDRSYSYLVDTVPGKSMQFENELIEQNCKSLLDELTVFKPAQHYIGRNLQQGCYTLKQSVWENDYDPVQVQYRFSQKRDYQLSLERFYSMCKQTGLLSKQINSYSSLWPPFKIPKNIGTFGQMDLSSLLECPTLIGLIFSVLYKSIYVKDIPESVTASVIHLLELALRRCLENQSRDMTQTQPNEVNSSFVGLLSYVELKAKSHIDPNHDTLIGCQIYAASANESVCIQEKSCIFKKNSRLFPVVRDALDLEYKATWFPFHSVIDNSLVHIENVHASMSIAEFVNLLQSLKDLNDQQSTSSSSTHKKDATRSHGTTTPPAGFIDNPELPDEHTENSEPMAWTPAEMDFFVDENASTSNDSDFDASDEEENENSTDDDPDNEKDRKPLDQNSTHSSIRISSHRSDAAAPCDSEIVADNDHATMPEVQSNALSLIPVNRQNPSTNHGEQQNEQMFAENLITIPRRAILASEPRPMIEGAVQPLALEASPAVSHMDVEDEQQQFASIPEQQSSEAPAGGGLLSDADIQERFTGFFSHSNDQPRRQLIVGQVLNRTARPFHSNSPFSMHDPHGSHPLRSRIMLRRPNVSAAANFQNQSANENSPSALQQRSNEGNNHGIDASVLFHDLDDYVNSAAATRHSYRVPGSASGNNEGRTTARLFLNRFLSARCMRQPDQQQDSKNIQQQDKREKGDLSNNKEWVGESLLTLLLRLHAKYSQKVKSYEFKEERARENTSALRSRIGDGVHFVTVALDLVCMLDQRLIVKLEQLQNLIWDEKEVHLKYHDIEVGSDNEINKTANSLGDDSMGSANRSLNTTSSSHRASSAGHSSSFESRSPMTATSSSLMSPSERRRRAKEYQSKVMAEFASKQRAFIEKYESSKRPSHRLYAVATNRTNPRSASEEEEPINLSSKMSTVSKMMGESSGASASSHLDKQSCKDRSIGDDNNDEQANKRPGDSVSGRTIEPAPTAEMPIYECCICGLEGPSDLANPFGQVVHLQSTSILGHAHLRPQRERSLPCDESHHLALRDETYAKYLERRIDLLCEHFSESSWLDSINIGVEGGVHVQSCGHYLHIECHQSYMESVSLDIRPYGPGGLQPGASVRISSEEFPCPVCRQSANSVLPILSDLRRRRRPIHRLSLAPSPSLHQSEMSATDINCEPNSDHHYDTNDFNQQIKLIGSLFSQRLAPHYKELRASASFCAHLTKATAPQYRLVRSNASMHSLFLFLTSIARTNLELELIVRQATSATTSRCGSHQPHIDRLACSATEAASASSTSTSGVDPNPREESILSTTPVASTSTTASPAAIKGEAANKVALDKRNCFIHLFHVLALNAQTLINDQWFTCDEIWSHLTNCVDEKNRLSVKPTKSEVPLLLRDPLAMLLQFLFATITTISSTAASSAKANFACLVKILFNLTAIQSIALVLSYVSEQQQSEVKPTAPEFKDDDEQAVADFRRLLELVSQNLAPLLKRDNKEPLMNSTFRSSWPRFTSRESQPAEDTAAPPTAESDVTVMVADKKDEKGWPILLVENRVKLACLPFMRAAALLQHHLYGSATAAAAAVADSQSCNSTGGFPDLVISSDELLTNCEAIDADFSTLATYLGLFSRKVAPEPACGQVQVPVAGTVGCLVRALNWPPSAATTATERSGDDDDTGDNDNKAAAKLISSWCRELLLCRFGSEFSIAARTLLACRSLAWFPPSLMKLPQLFDDVFMFYYRKKCSLCHQVRRDVAVCLVCGAPICFRMSCCKDRAESGEVHSQHCSSSTTAVFLAVHTSSIVVIRNYRACVWGSVYLDAHGEEDNGLQRGKPLYLVPARFELLQRQWLTHSFDDKYSKNWINLQDMNHHQHYQHRQY